MDFSYSALFFFRRRTSFTENGIGIDGCLPPTSCQASPDVDVALMLCVARRWLPGLAFGKTRKKSVLCQFLRNINKPNWRCCSHRLSRDKYKATWGLWADALVGSQLVHYKVPVFQNWLIWLRAPGLAFLGRERAGSVKRSLWCVLFCAVWIS